MHCLESFRPPPPRKSVLFSSVREGGWDICWNYIVSYSKGTTALKVHFHFIDQGPKPAEYNLTPKYPTSYCTRVSSCLVGKVCIRAKQPIRPELNYLQGAKKVSFTTCYSGKRQLSCTSPKVISTSPQKVFEQQDLLQFFCNLYFSKIFTSNVHLASQKQNSQVRYIADFSLEQTLLSLHAMFSSYLVINVSPNGEVSVSLSLSLFSALLGRESCATADEPRRGKLGDVSMVSINGREILLNQPAYSLFYFFNYQTLTKSIFDIFSFYYFFQWNKSTLGHCVQNGIMAEQCY